MPPGSNISNRQQSQPSATKSPLSQPPLNSADVAKVRGKKRTKDAPRDSIEVPQPQVETKAVADDLIEQEPLSPLPDLPAKPIYPMREPQGNVDSPILGALGPFGSTQDPDIVTRTDSWARSIPFGKSPPTEPTDGMTVGESPPQFSLPGRGDAFLQPSSSSASPHGKPRPLSYVDDYSTSAPSSRSRDRQKRSSLSSQRLSHPLPHLPQPHFFHAPDVEIPGQPNQRPHSDTGYTFCSVDVLSHTPSGSSKTVDHVVLVGRDGILEVLTVDNGAKVAAAISGLNGRVIGAKMLTWESGPDPFAAYRPLVAITIHGPAVIQKDENGTVSSGESDQTDLIPGPPKQRQKRDESLYVQTRAEVYSLSSQQLISTLFATKPALCFETFPGLRPNVPPPAANLRVLASGNYVIVASGTSGEVMIFGVIGKSSAEFYQCLGKTWTNVQPREYRRYSNSSASTDTDDFQSESGGSSKLVDMPIVAISGRWLAVVSPSPNMVSLHGSTPPPVARKNKYGIDAHVPPSRPSITCGVDSGEGESFLNKVARGLTQEVFKGARWIGDQGMQTWNNYWNKDSQSMSNTTTMRRANNFDQQLGADFMPPTHAQDTQYPPDDPDLVSIYDLKYLEAIQDVKSSFPSPVATFEPPNGCSFLSFSPNGLMLMTASKKGDVQYVWDLMQIRLCRARALITDDASSIASKSNPSAAHVRQMTRYTRLTTSTVRDVIWTGHTGEHLGIITKNGTIHVHDIPPNAFRWPPLRRISNPAPSTRGDNYMRDEALDEGGSFSAFSAAAKLVGDKTQPFLAAVRGRTPSVGAAFSNPGFGIPLAAGYGSKAVATGLSKSMGAATETVNNLRRAGENRLHLNRFTRDTMISKAIWIGGMKRNISLGVVDNGAFKVHQILKSIPPQNSNKRSQSIIGPKIQQVRLPPDLQNPCTTDQVILGTSDQVSGFYSITLRPRRHKRRSRPLAHAEIEANAPYQPFHTDRRVNLYVYPEHGSNSTSEPWVFGDDIPATKILLRAESHDGDDSVDGTGSKANKNDIENLISLGSAGEAAEHVVITTRRKKKSANHPGAEFADDEDGFFEDDCDVLDFARDRV